MKKILKVQKKKKKGMVKTLIQIILHPSFIPDCCLTMLRLVIFLSFQDKGIKFPSKYLANSEKGGK